jgi:hypothetical protein
MMRNGMLPAVVAVVASHQHPPPSQKQRDEMTSGTMPSVGERSHSSHRPIAVTVTVVVFVVVVAVAVSIAGFKLIVVSLDR